MSLKKMSRREHVLVIIAWGILIGMVYVPFRYLPSLKETKGLIEETEKTWAKQKEIKLPKEPPEDPELLEKERMEAERSLTGMRTAIASLEGAFAPVDSPEVLHGLQVEISDLARASGVRVLGIKPYEPKSPPAQGVKQSVPDTSGSKGSVYGSGGTPYPRPMRRLEAATSYGGFKRFIRGLNNLHWRVTVAEFTLEKAEPAKRGPGGEPLTVTLILAL